MQSNSSFYDNVSAFSHREDYTVYCFLCVYRSRRPRNQRTLAADISTGVVGGDEIRQLDRGALLYVITQTGELWPRRSPWGAKKVKGVNNFLTLWHGYWCVADHFLF